MFSNALELWKIRHRGVYAELVSKEQFNGSGGSTSNSPSPRYLVLRRSHISDSCCPEQHELTHERPIRSILIRTAARPKFTCQLEHGVPWCRAAYAHSAMGEQQSAIGLTDAWTHVCASIYMKCGFENSELWGSAKLGNADIFARANVTPPVHARSGLPVALTILNKYFGAA